MYCALNLPTKRELVILPDGGTIALDWFEENNPTLLSEAPIIILHHGLGGSTMSVYIQVSNQSDVFHFKLLHFLAYGR